MTQRLIKKADHSGRVPAFEIMVSNNMVSSNAEAKRMIKQGAVKLNDEKVIDINLEISPNKNIILKVGKRKFLKII